MIPEPIPIPESIPEPLPILKPILVPIPIPESILEPISELIMESIPNLDTNPETDSGPAFRNRFQKTAELAGIDSDKNFIFPITNCYEAFHVLLLLEQKILPFNFKFTFVVQSKLLLVSILYYIFYFEESLEMKRTIFHTFSPHSHARTITTISFTIRILVHHRQIFPFCSIINV